MTPLRPPALVLRWGHAEYDPTERWVLPEGVTVRTVRGENVPLEEADVLVVPSATRVRAEHVARLRRCQLILTTTSGFDHLDLASVRAAGIRAARMPLLRRDAVVEAALGMMLSLSRRFGPLQEAARVGRWERGNLPALSPRLLGTVGVVGVGVIGSRMCTVLEALGAPVLRCDPNLPDGAPLATVLAESDVVTLHCSLNAANRGMIDAAAIAAMRPGSILVNTARGPLVDVSAAMDAVRTGHLAGLGLDVFPTEPADLADLAHPRVLVTPHAAGWHPGLEDGVGEAVAIAVRALLAGERVPYEL
jgi:phosphoglycerate dehydrogenase-like enzyme